MPPKPTRSRTNDGGRPASPRLPDFEEEVIPTSIFSPEEHSRLSSAAAPEPAYLYVERGPGSGQLVPVREGTLVVGRASVSDLRLQHASISRRHAQITREGDRIFVRDLGSQNGTFVNKTKIATEIEVQIGDQIALGNAILVLKDQNVPSEVEEALPVAARHGRAKRGGKLWRISVVAGAAGFGLAGMLMFALVKVANGPSEETPAVTESAGPQPGTRPTPQPPAKAEKSRERATAAKESKERSRGAEKNRETRDTAPAERTKSGSASADSPSSTKSSKSALASKISDEFEVAAPKRSRTASAEKPEESDEEEVVEKEEKPKRKPGGILGKYKDGDVAAAIEMAEEADDSDMSDKLIKFNRLYKEAQSALSGRDGVVAIRALSAAVRQDELIAKGKSKYGDELRQKLAELYTMVGKKHLDSFKRDDAKKAFQAALKYDPKNAQALTELKALSGGIEVRADGADTSSSASSSSSDDEEEEEEEAPPPRKKVRKAAAKSSGGGGSAIDDAFGD